MAEPSNIESPGPVSDELFESAWEEFWAVRNPSSKQTDRGKVSLRAALDHIARVLTAQHAAELARLRVLVGDEGQLGWDGCSRADAIRQAQLTHDDIRLWICRHGERLREREAVEAKLADAQAQHAVEVQNLRDTKERLGVDLGHLLEIIKEQSRKLVAVEEQGREQAVRAIEVRAAELRANLRNDSTYGISYVLGMEEAAELTTATQSPVEEPEQIRIDSGVLRQADRDLIASVIKAGHAQELRVEFSEDVDTAPTDLDGAAHSVWLHGNWRWLTKQMRTPEKDAFADAVERCWDAAAVEDPDEAMSAEVRAELRWWRDPSDLPVVEPARAEGLAPEFPATASPAYGAAEGGATKFEASEQIRIDARLLSDEDRATIGKLTGARYVREPNVDLGDAEDTDEDLPGQVFEKVQASLGRGEELSYYQIILITLAFLDLPARDARARAAEQARAVKIIQDTVSPILPWLRDVYQSTLAVIGNPPSGDGAE